MRRTICLLVAIMCFGLFHQDTDAGSRQRKSSYSSGRTSVRAYHRKDGTYVRSHTRKTSGNGSFRAQSHSGSRRSSKSYRSSYSHYTPTYSTKKAIGVERNAKGRIKRSESEKKKFLRQHGYSRVPAGYEVDHVVPLYKGGADKAYNMQLIPKSEHKAKHSKR